MNRYLTKCISNNNNRILKSSKNYFQSNTRLNNSNLVNNLINNNYNSNALINSTLLQQYQKRDSSFITTVISNIKHMIESNPEHVQLMEDFDRIFLNNRFKKKKEKEEEEKREYEAKMEAYSKSAEQRAREEAHLSPEEIKKRREEEQKLYEELLKDKYKKQGFQDVATELPSNDEFELAQDVKLYTENETMEEINQLNNNLKAIYDRVNGRRPLPQLVNRKEPTFEECQDFTYIGEFGLYDIDPNTGFPVNTDPSLPLFDIKEHFNLEMESYEPVDKFLRETDSEARSLGIQYETIDWDSFLYTKEDVDLLPKPYVEFLERKLDMQYGEKIKELEEKENQKEEEFKKYFEELEVQGDSGRNLNAPDNPRNYPVPFIDNSEPIATDPLFVRIYDSIMDKIPEQFFTTYIYEYFARTKKGIPSNRAIIENWELFAPGTTLDRLMIELRAHFLPNFFYHYFRGHFRELEQYTDEESLEEIKKMINELEGKYRILNHEVVGVSKIHFCKFMMMEENTLLKVSYKVLHKVGLRDYEGNNINLSMEDRNGLYITQFTAYLKLSSKNRFGWIIDYLDSTESIKVLNIVDDDEYPQYTEWRLKENEKAEQIRKEEEKLEEEEKKKLEEEEEKKLALNKSEDKSEDKSGDKSTKSGDKSTQSKSK